MKCGTKTILLRHKQTGEYAVLPLRCNSWSCSYCGPIKQKQYSELFKYYIRLFKLVFFSTLTVNSNLPGSYDYLNRHFRRILRKLRYFYSLPPKQFVKRAKEYISYDVHMHYYRKTRIQAIYLVASLHDIRYNSLSLEERKNFKDEFKDEIDKCHAKLLRDYSDPEIERKLLTAYQISYLLFQEHGLSFIRVLEHPETNLHFHILLNVIIPEQFLQGQKGVNEIYGYPEITYDNFTKSVGLDPVRSSAHLEKLGIHYYNDVALYLSKYLSKEMLQSVNTRRLISTSKNIRFDILKSKDWDYKETLDISVPSFTTLSSSYQSSIKLLEDISRQQNITNSFVSEYTTYMDLRELYLSRRHIIVQQIKQEEKNLRRSLASNLFSKLKREYENRLFDLCHRVLDSFTNLSKTVAGWRFPLLITNLSSDVKRLSHSLSRSNIVFVSGPAGSGKTTLISKFLESYAFSSSDVLLLAPSGKASDVLRSKTSHCFSSMTIQKACQSSFNKSVLGVPLFSTSPSNCLPYKLIIIDECSMVNIEVFLQLLLSLRPEAKLILLGDNNQLQPVNSSSIVQLLMDHHVSYIHLDTNYRNDAETLSLAHMVLKDYRGFLSSLKTITEEEMKNIVNQCLNCDTVQFLTDTRRLSYVINDLITGGVYRVGQKVISTVNNRMKNIFNGQIGFIEYIDDNSCIINYRGHKVSYSLPEFHHFTHAYSLTIHKFQGSECDEGIIFLSSPKMLTKELLYTAITRFRKKPQIFIVGDKK